MLVAAKPTANFVNAHPTVKMLALSFLLLIGMALVADGLHYHIPRGYLYFAIAFSGLVEALNLLTEGPRSPPCGGRTGPRVQRPPLRASPGLTRPPPALQPQRRHRPRGWQRGEGPMGTQMKLLVGAAVVALGVTAARAETPKDGLVHGRLHRRHDQPRPGRGVRVLRPPRSQAQIYDRLVTYPVDDVSKLEGLVAESWSVSDDGMQVHLQDPRRHQVPLRQPADRRRTSPTRCSAW